MAKRLDLTEGYIVNKLIKLALPIMATSFIQMAYNMADMIWIGRVGSNEVAAVGTAGFFVMIAASLSMISKVGVEVKVAQSLGRHDDVAAKRYIVSAIHINIVLSFIYSLIVILFRKQFIGFFRLGNEDVINMAEIYLVTIASAMFITSMIPVFTAIFNGAGNSKIPFFINTIGLIINIVLDPILIMGIGPFPKLGVLGAALATIIAQIVVVGYFIFVILKSKEEYLKINIFRVQKLSTIKTIFKLGIPSGIQNGLFTLFSILIARVIAVWGPVPIAVQKVGSQIEAISWMTAGGFSTALGAFVGQNYGAKKYDRIKKGYKVTMTIAMLVGTLTSLILIFFGGFIFSIFIPEKEAILYGKEYLKILGYSQLFMCIEITTAGAFNGIGRTYIPATISIILTGLRVPFAILLSSASILGLNGVWWSISMSSVFKGIVLTLIFVVMLKKDKLIKKEAKVQ